MPKIAVRAVEEADLEGYATVRSLVYNDGVPIPEERWQSRFSPGYVAELDGQIAGAFNVLPMNATRGPALLACGGVAGVAVAPDCRRSGVGGTMMNWLVRHLRETGVPLASLYAFRESFYRRSGYEVCGRRIRVTCPTHRLPKVSSDLPVRRLGPDDWALLAPCYEQFAHRRSGLHIRNETMWSRVLNEHRPLAIYAVGDPIEGYISISHKTDFWVEQWLSEVVWSTPTGYSALLALMAQLGSNKTALAWYEPSDSPFYAQFADQAVEFRIERPVMVRVCDVPAAFSGLKTSETGEFTIEVDDEQVPENRGPWRVAYSPTEIAVTPAHQADLSLHIRWLAPALLGEPDLSTLADQGLVNVRSAPALAAATRLLSPNPVFCADFF